MKRKSLSIFLALLLVFSLLPACSTSTNDSELEDEYIEYEEEAEFDDDSTDTPFNCKKEGKDAYEAAKYILSLFPFSRQELIDKLTYSEDYLEDEAEAGVSKLEESGEVDWVENAIQQAQLIYNSDLDDFTEEEAFQELTENELFTEDEARAAIDAVYH